MDTRYEAHCRYCGDAWEIDESSDDLTDDEFVEITRTHKMYVVCENCARRYLR
jgi:hypothetical protein